MNHFSIIVLAGALVISASAQDAKTNSTAADAMSAGQTFIASAATLTAPLVLTNDYIYLTGDQAELTNSGRAVFEFTITNAGDYVIDAQVNAPDEGSNSFYLNVDAMPKDPEMIWDIDVTDGFAKRTVSWRGNGDATTDAISPKRFKLAPGAHQFIIIGREPGTELKSLTIRPVAAE